VDEAEPLFDIIPERDGDDVPDTLFDTNADRLGEEVPDPLLDPSPERDSDGVAVPLRVPDTVPVPVLEVVDVPLKLSDGLPLVDTLADADLLADADSLPELLPDTEALELTDQEAVVIPLIVGLTLIINVVDAEFVGISDLRDVAETLRDPLSEGDVLSQLLPDRLTDAEALTVTDVEPLFDTDVEELPSPDDDPERLVVVETVPEGLTDPVFDTVADKDAV